MKDSSFVCLRAACIFLTAFQRMWPLIKLFPLNIIKVWRNLKIHRRIWKIMWTANAVDTFIYKKLSRENKLLKDKQSWSPPSMVSYFYPTISISIGLVPRMLVRLYCSTLWTGPCKGVKQDAHHSWLFMEIQIQIASYCSRSNLIQGGTGE